MTYKVTPPGLRRKDLPGGFLSSVLNLSYTQLMSLVVELSEAGPGDGVRIQLPSGQTDVTRELVDMSPDKHRITRYHYGPSGRFCSDGVPIYIRTSSEVEEP